MPQTQQPRHQHISMVDQVMSRVKESIVSGAYRPGEKLPAETELMAMCKASRSSVREAMKILSALGIIEIRRGSGTYVTDNNSRHVAQEPVLPAPEMPYTRQELMDYREVVECALLELLIRNHTEEDVEALEKCNAKMKEEIEGECNRDRLMELDIAFHMELGRRCSNRLMESLNQSLMEAVRPHLSRDYHTVQYIGFISYVNHQQIIDSLRYGDSSMARRTIEECKKTFFATL